MAPPKTSEYEQDHTKVEEEAGDDAAHGLRTAASSAESASNKVHGRRKRDTIYIVGGGIPGVRVKHVPNEGQGKHDLILEFGGRRDLNHLTQPTYRHDYDGDVTCGKPQLQQSLKTLIENWHKDRNKQNREWDQVWEEIEGRVELLSEDISKHKESMKKYCNDPSVKGKTWTEADSNACMLITAGLKHIYEIKEDTGKNGEQARKNNRTFRATAACIILNELIKKLEKKAKSCTQIISIKEGIKQAFKVSKEIKKAVCDNDFDCFECTQQQDYSNCTMNKERVGEKLKTKIDKDEKIKEALGEIYPPSDPNSPTGTATIGEWFTQFSTNVTEKDKEQYEELGALLALCEQNEDEESSGKWDREKYGSFCEIMIKNIILTTAVPKQYKNEKGKTSCQKIVKGIPVCDLLKVWMYYMPFFCAPKEVIEEALSQVKTVREALNKNQNYVHCTYDDALKIPYGGGNDMGSEAYDLFGTSTLYNMMKKTTNKKEWCKNAPAGAPVARADKDTPDRVVPSDDASNKFKEIVEQLEEVLEQEEKATSPAKSPSVDDCNGKTSCEFVKCIADEWARIRSHGPSKKPESDVWNDFPDILKSLSNAMTNGQGTNEKECEGINVADSTKEEANKKACNYIVKGLTYIYGIDLSYDSVKQANPYLNKRFQQTMACLLLNEFAKQMKSKCPDSKAGIDKGFESWEQIKGKKCTNTSYPCVDCKWEEGDYSDCTIGNEQVKDKVKGILDTNDNIKKTLEDICKKDAPPEKTEKTQDTVQQPSEEDDDEPPPLPAVPNGDQDEPSVDPGPVPGGEPHAEAEPIPGNTDPNQSPQEPAAAGDTHLGAGGASSIPDTPSPSKLTSKIDLPTSYLPLIPSVTGILVMSYLLWKYFAFLGKRRKRYRRAHQVNGPTIQEQLLAYVEEGGPHEYYIVKERKPRSTPMKRRKKRGVRRRAGRCGVRRRMIIDIHLEVLNECQKGDLHSKKEDFFKILVQEFMGSEFIKEEPVPQEQVQDSCSAFRVNFPMEQVPSSDSGFSEEDFIPKEDVPVEQVPCSDSGFRGGRLCS
ncbi:SICA antigen [Plasmodium coatneyi]|uniref:SICA antigen n=1 Tax=Plasmodium coatneyi TaxID=208452 RepID=A0A1B1E0V8_9APIC|nr:SICA antigen [Plasmodium coatneyi]ANQ08658.1 SICA antigen [Plasmodium coatneyi]